LFFFCFSIVVVAEPIHNNNRHFKMPIALWNQRPK